MKNIKTFENFLNESKVMNIIELSKMVSRLGVNSASILKVLQEEYKKCGDQCVIDIFKEMTGLDLESLSRGRYVFKYFNESVKYINDEHKNYVSLARRLEYHLNKYFNAKKVTDEGHVWVTPHYNHKGPGYEYHTDYDISFNLYSRSEKESHDRLDYLYNYLDEITNKRQRTFIHLSKEEAEKLLLNLKTNFAIYNAEKVAEKYNL